MKRLNAALAYARKGIHVFPLQANSKEPLAGVSWKSLATTDERQIKKIWTKNPDYNIGVAAEPSGLVIIDLDNKGEKKGSIEFANLRAAANELAAETLIVRTPSGGEHVYYIGDTVQTNAGRVGPGIDVRSQGGYVVGIGSEIDGVAYEPVSAPGTALALVPDWLKPHLTPRRPKDPDAGKAIVELDQPRAIEAATKHLEREPGAMQGAGGDQHTFKVACQLLDFGLSMGVAHRLLSEHWNDKCSPPWSEADLMRKVRNAWTYRSQPVGVDSVDAAFEGLDGEEAKKPFVGPLAWPDEAMLPRRRWLLGRSLLRGKITQLVADGGAGKSTFAIQCGVAVVTDRREIVGEEVVEKTGVLIINNEDDLVEMYRRLYAVMKAFKIQRSELDGKLFLYSGVDKAFLMVTRDNHGRLAAHRYSEIKREILQNNIGLLIVDPLVETHEAEENDNKEMSFVMRTFRQLANECDAALMIVHHTNKTSAATSVGFAGKQHSSRGASAVGGVARVVQTIYEMNGQEAEEYGVDNPYDYVRLDDAKANLSAKRKDPRWFKKHVVDLENGDQVAVFKPVVLTAVTVSEIDNILELLGNDWGTLTLDQAADKLKGVEYGSKTQAKDLLKRTFAKPVVIDGDTIRLSGQVLMRRTA